ncbi:ATP-binding protein [Sphingobacterium sp. LRF_L2]|uniref:ATP-binding protein n=1 Tax=Sphingobacterium sp. LRF_L2 TaxID=3369421 RepID=UPI003F6265FE
MTHINKTLLNIALQTEIPRVFIDAKTKDFKIIDYSSAFKELFGEADSYLVGNSFIQFLEAANMATVDLQHLQNSFIQAVFERKNVSVPFSFYEGQQVILSFDKSGNWIFEIKPLLNDDDAIAYLFLDLILVEKNDILDRSERQQLVAESVSSKGSLDKERKLLSVFKQSNTLGERNEKVPLDMEQKVALAIQRISESESDLRNLVMTAHYPLMILRGEDWIIEIANQPLVDLWEKTIEGVTGQKLMDILPEIANQPFPKLLRRVFETGQGYGEEEQLFFYHSPSGPAIKYVNFFYDPLRNDMGETVGIIVAAEDVTANVHQRKALEESLAKEQRLVKEMSSLNDELAASIEELSATNEELLSYQKDLNDRNERLKQSEERFRLLVKQAPVGICVIRAFDLIVLEVNDGYLELVGKLRDEVQYRPIWEAVAEASEGYAHVMQEVVNTGKAFVAKEHEVLLVRYGTPQTLYLDFVYEPVIATDGAVTAIMVVCIDVTEKVWSRRAIEEASERTRLAVEAAEIGTYDHNYVTNTLVTSERFDEIFDYPKPISRQELLPRIHPDDLHLSTAAHIIAAREGKVTYEMRLLFSDGSIRWIRVHGKVVYQLDGKPGKLLGTVIDITDFKRLQQQKDDFISIASHELKTPVTTLKAALQLLVRLQDKADAVTFTRLLTQATRSMDRVTMLIEDLLNVSAMGSGSVGLNKRNFLVKDLLDTCCSHVRESGEHTLVFEGDSQLEVFADENRIEQVIVNFVNNAVKYAPQSQQVFLGVKRIDGFAKIYVRDSGPGIPQDKQKHIFERYVRAEDNSIKVSGLGLGLYISADIIRRHGGEIGVDSIFGKGATFWFTLPLG